MLPCHGDAAPARRGDRGSIARRWHRAASCAAAGRRDSGRGRVAYPAGWRGSGRRVATARSAGSAAPSPGDPAPVGAALEPAVKMAAALTHPVGDAIEALGRPGGLELDIAPGGAAAGDMAEQLLDEADILVLLQQLRPHEMAPEMEVHREPRPPRDEPGDGGGELAIGFVPGRRGAGEEKA